MSLGSLMATCLLGMPYQSITGLDGIEEESGLIYHFPIRLVYSMGIGVQPMQASPYRPSLGGQMFG